jgi:hypothetical protein
MGDAPLFSHLIKPSEIVSAAGTVLSCTSPLMMMTMDDDYLTTEYYRSLPQVRSGIVEKARWKCHCRFAVVMWPLGGPPLASQLLASAAHRRGLPRTSVVGSAAAFRMFERSQAQVRRYLRGSLSCLVGRGSMVLDWT